MTANRTIQYLQAEVHRAEQCGSTGLTINIKDLAEILNLAQRAEHMTPVKRETQHAGFIHPEALAGILSGTKGSTRIHRSQKGGNVIQLLFSGNLKEIRRATAAPVLETTE